MYSLESFKIDLKGLREGDTKITFRLDDDFFKAVNGSEVKSGLLDATLDIHRTASSYSIGFHAEGTVVVPCDICLEDMNQPVTAEGHLTARLGEEYSEDDDLITVDKEQGLLDMSWFVYEFVALSVPIKHAHEEDECNPDMIKALGKHITASTECDDEEKETDPRWNELKKLKTIIKD